MALLTLQVQFYISYAVFLAVTVILIIWLSILSHQIRMLRKLHNDLQSQLNDLNKPMDEEYFSQIFLIINLFYSFYFILTYII